MKYFDIISGVRECVQCKELVEKSIIGHDSKDQVFYTCKSCYENNSLGTTAIL